MSNLKENIKKYLLVKHAEAKLKECDRRVSKSIPWILRKGLMNNIETHCKVLLNSLLNEDEPQKLRRNKYIVDSILKYNIERSVNLITSNKKIKNIKPYMQLNSYIIYDEINKGFAEHKNKSSIDFNINAHLSKVQERINNSSDIEQVLNEELLEKII